MPNYFETIISSKQCLYGLLANRPAAGIQGRFYYATDTGEIFYDSGTVWEQIPMKLPVLTADIDLNGHKLLNPANLITLPIGSDIDLNGHKLLNPANLITLPIGSDIDLNGHKLLNPANLITLPIGSDIDLNGHKITNVGNPVDSQDVATKDYVDALPTGGFKSGFQATLSSDCNLNENSDAVLPFDNVLFDGLNEFNSSSYRFTVQTSGRYLINVSFKVYTTEAGCARYYIKLYKNGNIFRNFIHGTIDSSSGGANDSASASVIEELSEGDYIDIRGAWTYLRVRVDQCSFFSAQRVY